MRSLSKYSYFFFAAVALTLQACRVDALIDGTVVKGVPNPSTTLAWSEQSAFTASGRLFVVGGDKPFTYGPAGVIVNGTSYIYEIKKTALGKTVNVPLVAGDVNGLTCYFGGLAAIGQVLYATCTNLSNPLPASVLYRLDTRLAVGEAGRVRTTPLNTVAFQPNGIAVDAQGDLYIANSASFVATNIYGIPGVPAIVKIRFSDASGQAFTENSWLPAAFGGYFPNGASIVGNQLYFPSLNILYRVTIMPGGAASAPVVVYQGPKTRLFDTVTALPNNLVAIPEITNPNPDIVQIAYPGTPAPTTPTHQITLVDATMGKQIGAAPFPSHARPSSVVVGRAPMFSPASAIVTDAIGAGGLYLLH